MIKLTFKPDNDLLVAEHGHFRITLAEQVLDNGNIWGYQIYYKGVRLCNGHALERDNQQGCINTIQKLLIRFLSLEPHLISCASCNGAAWPFNPGVTQDQCPDCKIDPGDPAKRQPPRCNTCKGKGVLAPRIIFDEDWYAARAAAAAAFFGQNIPDHLVFRCLDKNCELHRQPQRRTE